MGLTRAQALIAQELEELIKKSTPYSLSTPQLGNPTLHDFVKGLILSTNIIDAIEKHLPDGYRANWGQIIDEKDGNTLSKECDIIIYEGKPFKEIKNNSMKFTFVGKNRAKVVIQVRSSIASVTKDDKAYCLELKKSVPEVWYIAECCLAKSKSRAETIRRELKSAGYKHFFYWYRRDYDSLERTIDYKPFLKFIDLIKRIR